MSSRKRVFVKLFIPTEVGAVSTSDLDNLLDQLHKVASQAVVATSKLISSHCSLPRISQAMYSVHAGKLVYSVQN